MEELFCVLTAHCSAYIRDALLLSPCHISLLPHQHHPSNQDPCYVRIDSVPDELLNDARLESVNSTCRR
eukprot:36018-Eustigmatos_ZCMA.PRE.1